MQYLIAYKTNEVINVQIDKDYNDILEFCCLYCYILLVAQQHYIATSVNE